MEALPERKNHLIFFKILNIFGIFPIQPVTKLWFAYSVFVHFYSPILMIFFLIYNCFYIESLNDFLESITYVIYLFTIILRIVNFHYYKNSIVKVFEKFEKLKPKQVRKQADLAEESFAKFAVRLLKIVPPAILTLNILRHYLVKRNAYIFTPALNFENFWQQEIVFWIQLTQSQLIFPGFVSVECIFISCIVILEARLKSIAHNLRNISGESGKTSLRMLKETIKYHLEVTG